MGFGNLGFGEIMLILVVVLLLFGAKRIPEIAGSFGRGIKEFKKNVNEAQSAITDTGRDESSRLRTPDPSPTSRPADETRPEPKRLI
jgi:sec-independent protein translocase protein TatA